MYTCAQFLAEVPLRYRESEEEKGMQIDFELSEVHANELANLLKNPADDIAGLGAIEFEVIEPLSGVMGDEEGKWTVRLKTSLATAAQIATITGFILARVPSTPPPYQKIFRIP